MSEPLYHRTYEARELLLKHPPRFQHPHKRALFDMAYPDGIASAGKIDVTRWKQQVPGTILFSPELAIDVLANFYDHKPAARSQPAVEWHVNFADPRVFAYYGSALFAQDEMQVAEHPLLASLRGALLAEGLIAETTDASGATPVLVENVQRRIEVATDANAAADRPLGLYGNHFAAAPSEAVRRATRRIEPPTISNIIAMAAPSGGDGDYTEAQIEGIFATAFTAFEAAVQRSVRTMGSSCETAVHSGFWGCGAFGGNRKLMIALQTLAARAAKVSRLVFHAGDAAGVEDARRGLEVAESLVSRCGSSCSLDTLIGRAAILAFRWGVSDGN